MADSAASVAAAAAKVHTVGQARAALGVVADVCKQAYGATEGVTSLGGAAEAARARVDVVNNYAQKVYAELPTDDASQANAVSPLMAARVGLVLGQCHRALKDVEDAEVAAPNFNFVDLLEQGIANAGELLGKGIQKATNAAAGGLFAFLRAAWPTVLIVGVVVVALLWLRKSALRKVLP